MRQEMKDRIIERSIAGLIVGIIMMLICIPFGIWYNPTHRG